jgi:aminoglycoside 6-adenylyltransferase
MNPFPPSTFTPELETLFFLVRWGESQPLVRAMILTSTRAIPGASSDAFSDYDVVLALSDVRPFAEDRLWLEAFGHVLVMWQDPLESDEGRLHSGNVVQFESGLKIDFTLVEPGYFASLKAQELPLLQMQDVPALQNVFELPTELDAGYRVLLDKDGLTAGLPPPTYRAYIPHPPTQVEYMDMVEGGLLDATYVAKYLRRNDRLAAQHIFENYLKQEHLIPLLVWHYEIDHGWEVTPRLYGRRMQQYLRPDLWAGLERTYCGLGLQESWRALFNALELARKAAREVGERLGFAYPEDMFQRALAYLQEVRETNLPALDNPKPA